MKVNKILPKLVRRLLTQSVGYLPLELVSDDIQELTSLPIKKYGDQLVYLSKDKKIIPLKNSEAFKNIIEKRFQLEKTVSNLVRLKGISDELEFSYLQSKYIDLLNALCFVSKLLNDNVVKYFPNESLILYDIFQLQQNTLEEHRNELAKLFQFSYNQSYTLEDLKSMFLVQNPTIDEPFSFEAIKQQPELLQENNSKNNELISDEQAQDFLLETVFSVTVADNLKK